MEGYISFMKQQTLRYKTGGILLFFFILIQVFRPSKNKGAASGPEDITQVYTVPGAVLSILKKSCYDCHSNQTVYPWYNNVAPASWWMAYHVDEGKRELNFTLFKQYTPGRRAESLEAIAEAVKYDRMPLGSYLFMHRSASLTDQQKTLLINWASHAKKSSAEN